MVPESTAASVAGSLGQPMSPAATAPIAITCQRNAGIFPVVIIPIASCSSPLTGWFCPDP
jgi:hypothetical protein